MEQIFVKLVKKNLVTIWAARIAIDQINELKGSQTDFNN